MVHLIGLPRTRTFRVLWMLEELGVPYTHEDAAPRSDPVLAASYLGKIPVLIDGDTAISDSVAIMTYLADKHGQHTHPAGTLARATQDAVTQQINDEIDALLWTAARHSFILPEDRRVPAIKDAMKWEFEQNVSRLSQRLNGPYLGGDMFTLTDILAVHCFNWAYVAKFRITDDAILTYAKAIRARPAYIRASEKAGM